MFTVIVGVLPAYVVISKDVGDSVSTEKEIGGVAAKTERDNETVARARKNFILFTLTNSFLPNIPIGASGSYGKTGGYDFRIPPVIFHH